MISRAFLKGFGPGARPLTSLHLPAVCSSILEFASNWFDADSLHVCSMSQLFQQAVRPHPNLFSELCGSGLPTRSVVQSRYLHMLRYLMTDTSRGYSEKVMPVCT